MSGTGVILRVAGPLVEAETAATVAMNELVFLGSAGIPGEVVAIRDRRLTVQAYEYTGGLGPGQPVVPGGRPLSARLGPWLLGGVFDGLLRPLSGAGTWLTPGSRERPPERRWEFRPGVRVGDSVTAGDVLGTVAVDGPLEYRVTVPPGRGGNVGSVADAGPLTAAAAVAAVGGSAVAMAQDWPIRRARPFRRRRGSREPLHTGQRVLDVLFPVLLGGTAMVPGGFGTGKTVLLQQTAKWCDADVIVYVGCGERGNEMAETVTELFELADPRTGGRLADRTVVIANTSNMPMMAREASVYAGVTVAEFFRDMGYRAVVIADSTSRWAEALREFASRTGELPAEEGYPASLASALAAFYERAGAVDTLGGRGGSVTVIGAVSPPGGDLTEPVTAQTERFVRCSWTLDRDLAYARHYPAVSWARSFSRDTDEVGAFHARTGDPGWGERRGRAVGLLAEADRLSALTELVGAGALPGLERVVVLGGRLLRESVLQQNALSANDAFCGRDKAKALVEAVLTVVDRCREAVDSGIPASLVEEVDFGPLVRARERSGPDDPSAVARERDAVIARIGRLS